MQRSAAKISRRRGSGGSPTAKRVLRELANLRDDCLGRFHSRCPRLFYKNDEELLQHRDELRLIWPGPRKDFGDEEAGSMIGSGINLSERSKWVTDITDEHPEIDDKEVVLETWLARCNRPIIIDRTWGLWRLRVGLDVLPMALAAAYLMYARSLRFCGNSECAAPYFIASRKDQKFCCDECSAPAKREAKRKYWRKRRAVEKAEKSL